VLGLQVLIVIVVLLAWEYLPKIGDLRTKSHLFDPFFISSPSKIASRIDDILTGRHGSFEIWSYLGKTLLGAMLGTLIGMALGTLVGLLLSASRFLSRVFNPFVVGLNAVPRVALIPVIVVLVGPNLTASVVVVVLVVFFVAFFNAFEGGRTVPHRLLENSELLGASRWQEMWYIRLPYVLAWSLAALPLAVTFAILSVVTAEILTGVPGVGQLITNATANADATGTFAIVVVLSVVSIAIVGTMGLVRSRVLHWWDKN
jgi:NitT/TauT family transport system permease protein